MHADDLPEGWTSAPLAKVTRLSKEKWTPGTGEDRRYLSLEHIEAHTGRLLGHGSSDDVKSAKNVYDAGDVLYGKLRPYLSKVARPDAPGVCSTDILVFKPSEQLEQGYLNALLQSHAVTTHAMDHAKGINLPRVSPKALGTFETPVPPLPEQRRIVARLDAIEAHRRAAKEKLDRLPDLLDRYRQSVLAAAFRGDLTAAWREAHPDTEPASALLERIRAERRRRWIEDKAQKTTDRAQARDAKKGQAWTKADRTARLDKERAKAAKKHTPPEPVDATDLPDLPSGWSWIHLGDLADVGTGATPKRGNPDYWQGGTIPWVTSGAVNADRVDEPTEYTTEAALAETNLTLYPPGTLLVAMYGEGKTRGMCAELTIEATTNQALAAVALTGLAAPLKPWVRALLEKNYADIRRLSAGGVQPNLNLSMIRDIPIPIPPAAEMEVAASAVAEALSVHDRCSVLGSDAAERVETLRQATLARAFRGELVPTDAELARRYADSEQGREDPQVAVPS